MSSSNDHSRIAIWLLVLLTSLLAPRGTGATSPQAAFTGKVQTLALPGMALPERIQRALAAFSGGGGKGAFFVAYGIISRSHSFHQDGRTGEVHAEEGEIHIYGQGAGVTGVDAREGTGETIILLLFDPERKGKAPAGIGVLDAGKAYRFDRQPLYWVGMLDTKETDQSLDYLGKLFTHQDLKRKLLLPIALHPQPRALQFLYDVAAGREDDALRQDAVFWLGARRDPQALPYLRRLAQEEKGSRMRKKIVFSLYLQGNDEAVRDLIAMAHAEADSEVRREVVFWLGQKASAEAVQALKEAVAEDADLAVRRHAVFAISQLPRGKAVPLLMEIARTNPQPRLRKEAIFWLGQTGSDEAVKFFEEILLAKRK